MGIHVNNHLMRVKFLLATSGVDCIASFFLVVKQNSTVMLTQLVIVKNILAVGTGVSTGNTLNECHVGEEVN